jgi:hypothetical protein
VFGRKSKTKKKYKKKHFSKLQRRCKNRNAICFLYLEYDSTFSLTRPRHLPLIIKNGHLSNIIYTAQCPLLLSVYPSEILPLNKTNETGTIILNADPQTEDGSHWLAIHIEPRCSTSFHFDSYCLPPFVAAIQSFLRRTCTIWKYNKPQLQG